MVGFIGNVLKNHQLKSSIKKTAKNLAKGNICLFPSQGVYTLILDGNNLEVIEKFRRAKGRDSSKREGLISPPDRICQLIDFNILKEINNKITPEVIKKIYLANPVGLVVPCKEDSVPSHLITYKTIRGRRIPTVMNIWNPQYKFYDLLWKEVSKLPKVLWVGSSANLANQEPLNYERSRRVFAKTITQALKDPDLDHHKFQGSYTIISLIHNPPEVLRKGSIHPEKYPIEFQRFKDVLPQLVISN